MNRRDVLLQTIAELGLTHFVAPNGNIVVEQQILEV